MANASDPKMLLFGFHVPEGQSFGPACHYMECGVEDLDDNIEEMQTCCLVRLAKELCILPVTSCSGCVIALFWSGLHGSTTQHSKGADLCFLSGSGWLPSHMLQLDSSLPRRMEV